MGDSSISEGMLEVFIYESETMLESMEQLAMANEDSAFDTNSINEMFRSMHTIKGSSAIMMYNNITTTSHKLEDIFYYIRESHPENVPQRELVDLILKVSDFIKGELDKIKVGEQADGDETDLMAELEAFLEMLKTGIVDSGTELPPERVEPEIKNFYVAPQAFPNSHFYIIQVFFKSYVEMQNIKAYTMVYSLKESAEDMFYEPEDIMTNEESSVKIASDGFVMAVQTRISTEEIMAAIDHIGGTSNIEVNEVSANEYAAFVNMGAEKYFAARDRGESFDTPAQSAAQSAVPEIILDPSEAVGAGAAGQSTGTSASTAQPAGTAGSQSAGTASAAGPNTLGAAAGQNAGTAAGSTSKAAPASKAPITEKLVNTVTKEREAPAARQAFISVNVSKMDSLMDLIGELVIAEAVVLQNPDLKVPGLDLTNFQKAASQLQKISSELQDVIMAMRMMPLSNTFQKMKRIVHDVSGKLGKQIELVIIGEDTEVDKNIIEHISDPLMHLIRNSVDHGIEEAAEREAAGKPEKGRIVLEAKNEGGKVWISVSDDGKGLNREKIYNKALEQGLIVDPKKEYSDREIYSMITRPGFSTKDQVTELSGRGVGMDVVVQNIQNIGGSLDIESTEGEGSKMTLKIPLTLAIIDGIILRVGSQRYVVATGNVKEFLRASQSQIIMTPEGCESIMLRGECYPVLRLKEYYHLSEGVDAIEDGIVTIIEHEGRHVAVFIDELIGEQEIVVKPIPKYIKKIKGLSGCTQLGDGSISLILDAGSLIKD